MLRLVLSLTICLLGSIAWAADVRLALVIGNSKYLEFGTLDNPTNDAKGIDKTLRELGYSTRLVLDADESTLRREVKRFASATQGVDVALVYYAGHGSQVNGENYLLPTDLEAPKVETDIQLSSMKVDDIVNSLRSKVKIILLDACRDNPSLAKNLVKGRGTFRGGLAPISSSLDVGTNEGVFIAYATDAGNVASDGAGKQNSPFTAALLNNMREPVSIDDMFSMVTREVRRTTANKQRPYKYASLEGIFCIPLSCIQRSDIVVAPLSDSPLNINSRETNFKFIAEDRWTEFSDDKEAIFFLDYKSIETKENRKKINTLAYRFAPQNDPKSIYFMDSYTKAEFVFDCMNNTSFLTQSEIYNNKYEIATSSFFGNWKSLDISGSIKAGSVLSILKSITCDKPLPPAINNEEALEKFWSMTYDAEDDRVIKKILGVSYYDKSSIARAGNKAQVFIRVTSSPPVSLIAASNSPYREMTEISNKYKSDKIERLLTFDCKEDLVEESLMFYYSDKLKTPISVLVKIAEKIIPLGSFDNLKKIACKEI